MSSDEEVGDANGSFDNIDENNEILEIGEDLGDDVQEVQDQPEAEENTEEVQRDETADGDADGDRTTVKPKRVIRNPRPKLNEETLKGPRGLAALPTYFERVKFKGKGHEKQDLNAIMKTYEYWCHRLFPKYPFDTCIEKIENLGKKKAVQTHIKRIRFDLFVEDTPIIDSSDEETNVDGFVDITNEQINQQNQAFDQILPAQVANPASAPLELTDEQKERIRLNKEKAAKLREERLKKAKEKAEENLQVSSQLPSTSGLNLGDDDMESVGDVLSQKETELPNFDLESSVKGKAMVRGSTVKKKGSARQENKENVENEASMDAGEFQNGEDSNDTDFSQKRTKRLNRIVDSDDEGSYMENEASRDGEDTNDKRSLQKNKKLSRIIDSDEEDSNQASNIEESSNDSVPVKIATKKSNRMVDSDDDSIQIQSVENEASMDVEDSSDNFSLQKNTKKLTRSVGSDEENSVQGLNTGNVASQDGDDTNDNMSLEKNKKLSRIIDSDEEDQASYIEESSNDVKIATKKTNRVVDSDDDSIQIQSIENEASMDVDNSNDNALLQKKNKKVNGLVNSDVEGSNIENEASQDGEDTNDSVSLQKNDNKLKIMDSDEEDSNQVSNIEKSSSDSIPVKTATKKCNRMVDSDDETFKVAEAEKTKLIVTDKDSNSSALNSSAKINQNGLNLKSDGASKSPIQRRKNIIESDESDQEMEVI